MSEPDEVVTLLDEEGVEHDFTLIEVIEVDGSEYAILLPADEDDNEAIILKLAKDVEGNDLLVDIENDDEWDKVADAYKEMVDANDELIK